MPTPPLKNVRKSNPYRPVFDDMSRAIRDHSIIQSGPGFGVYTSPFGRMFRKTSQNYMMAVVNDDGVPRSTMIDAADPTAGITLGKGVAYEQTIDYDGADVRIVPAYRGQGVFGDEVTEIVCFNTRTAAVRPFSLVGLTKRFGLWFIDQYDVEAIARAKVTKPIPSGTFDAPSSGEAKIYRLGAGGVWQNTEAPVKVYNQHSLPSPIPVDGAIQMGLIDGDWFLLTADCP